MAGQRFVLAMARPRSVDRMKEQLVFQAAHPMIRRLSPLLLAMAKQGPWAERAALMEKKLATAIELFRAN